MTKDDIIAETIARSGIDRPTRGAPDWEIIIYLFEQNELLAELIVDLDKQIQELKRPILE